MNQTLADAGRAAVSDNALDPGNPNYPDDPGVKHRSHCARFNRCVNRKVYDQKYQHLYAGTARLSAFNFRDAGLAIPISQAQPLQIGDILWRTEGDGGFGHVTLLIDANTVAENSVAHEGEEPNGCKGTRPLSAVLPFVSLVTRLPDPAAPAAHWSVQVGNNPEQIICVESNGHAWCSVPAFAERLGLQASWDEAAARPEIEGKAIVDESGAPAPIITAPDGHSAAPVRALAATFGLQVSVNNDQRLIAVTRPAG